MTIRKIIFCFAIAFAIHPILSKDQTHEKPDEIPEPDTHRVFMRGHIGFGRYTIPEVGEGQTAATANMLLSGINGIQALNTNDIAKSIGTAQSNIGLEYRYKDKFRLLHDEISSTLEANNRNVSLQSNGTSLALNGGISAGLFQGGVYDWQEDVTKTGIAYFHPITNRFNVGAILRNYTVEQGYGLASRGALGLQDSTTSALGTTFSSTGSYAKATGLVPGLGLEYKIFRWLDFIYSYETVKLKGTKLDLTLEGTIFFGSTSSLLLLGIGGNLSNYTLTGSVHNAGFLLRYSSWFSTKFGVASQTFERKYQNYFSLGTNLDSILQKSIVYSSLVNSTSKLNNFYWQFEFSKGF